MQPKFGKANTLTQEETEQSLCFYRIFMRWYLDKLMALPEPEKSADIEVHDRYEVQSDWFEGKSDVGFAYYESTLRKMSLAEPEEKQLRDRIAHMVDNLPVSEKCGLLLLHMNCTQQQGLEHYHQFEKAAFFRDLDQMRHEFLDAYKAEEHPSHETPAPIKSHVAQLAASMGNNSVAHYLETLADRYGFGAIDAKGMLQSKGQSTA